MTDTGSSQPSPASPRSSAGLPQRDSALGSFDPAAVLRWYAENGVSTVEAASPADLAGWRGAPRLTMIDAAPTTPVQAASPTAQAAPSSQPAQPAPVLGSDAPMPKDQAMALARQLAASATDMPSIKAIIDRFEGCPLHKGAKQAVVYDGVPGSPLLVMGEAPGRDEDRQGLPFVGQSGQLLDRMLGAIGASRRPDDGLSDVLISNAIFWRPPGNRNPTKSEIAVCLPFMRRIVELTRPKVLLMTGNVPTQALFADAPGITKTRGQWRAFVLEDGTSVPALPIYHPAFLLRQPAQKRFAWTDLLAARARLDA